MKLPENRLPKHRVAKTQERFSQDLKLIREKFELVNALEIANRNLLREKTFVRWSMFALGVFSLGFTEVVIHFMRNL